MVGKQLFEMFGGRVERETIMTYHPFRLQLFHVIPDAVAIEFIVIPLVNAMQEIKVQISCPRSFEAYIDFIFGFLLTLRSKVRSIELIGQIVALTGISVAECSFGSLFRPLIDKCGVKIPATSLDKGIHHLLGVLQINVVRTFYSGQSHHAESQFHTVFNQVIHHHPYPFLCLVYCRRMT